MGAGTETQRWFAGVDGGGSRTRIALVDEQGRILHEGSTGSCNHQSTIHALPNLLELLAPVGELRRRRTEEGEEIQIEAMSFALSGWDFAVDRKLLRSNVHRALEASGLDPRSLSCDSDIFAVIQTGLGDDEDGICLIAGSGTLGAARSGGTLRRTWGFDYASGEWGSGTNLAVEAMHRIFSSAQGREDPCPVLTANALAHWKTPSVDALVEAACSEDFDQDRLAGFAVEVFAAAHDGCPTAESILRKGARAHARTVSALLRHLPEGPVPLVLGGGLFQYNGLLPGFREALRDLDAKLSEIRVLRSEPVWGSLLWSWKESGRSGTTFPLSRRNLVERLDP